MLQCGSGDFQTNSSVATRCIVGNSSLMRITLG
jgi:hypothetical protein